MRRIALTAGLLFILPALFAACGDGGDGLTRAEVQEIVREEMAGQARGADVALSFLADAKPIDDLAAEMAGRGVEIAEGPVSRPWNVRDFVVLDPDGYRLVFFAPVDTSRDFDDVMGDVLKA